MNLCAQENRMLKIALFGSGFMGRTHLQCYARNRHCRVQYVYGSDRDRVRALAREFGAEPVFEVDDVWNSDVDIVDLCLPTHLHMEYGVAAARAKKNILCEKPVANNQADAARLMAAVRRHGVSFMVAHVIRFWPEYVYIRELVRKGTLGKPLTLHARRQQPMPAWSVGNWITDPGLSLGGVVDLQIHDIDFINWVFGPPASLRSVGTRSERGGWEQINTLFSYPTGFNAVIEACNLMPRGYPFCMSLSILFTHGLVEFNSRDTPSLKVWRKNRPVACPAVPRGDGYQHEIDYFVDCVRRGRAPSVVTGEDACLALRLALSSKKSLDTSKEIFITRRNR
jgi:predicted dehydrogenase